MVSGAGTGKIAIQRGELATREMDVMAALINRQYVEHKAWFQCPVPSRGSQASGHGLIGGCCRPVPGF
jgi:hypothetical protein